MMQVWKKKKQGIGALLVFSVAGVVFWSATHDRSPMNKSARAKPSQVHDHSQTAAVGEGEPWYGGKPSIPVEIESSREGDLPVAQWVPVTVSFFSEMECQTISSRFRGVDSLEVSDSEWKTQPCQSAQGLTHDVEVRLADSEASAGYLAVDLEVQTHDGVRTVTRAVAFHRQGWKDQLSKLIGN